MFDERFMGRGGPEQTLSFEQDLAVIRQDIVAVLRETAHVRASMTEFSSLKPGVSKRFVVVCGLLCFIVISLLVICQGQLQALLQLP